MTYTKPPEYGRKKVDEIIGKVNQLASVAAVASDHDWKELMLPTLTKNDLLILNDMLYEMDRHLPDFFEVETEEESNGSSEKEDGSEEGSTEEESGVHTGAQVSSEE